MEGPGRSRSIAPQFVMGVLIIVVGVLFTLENLGFIEAASYLRFWPVALIAVGLMKLWSGGRGGPLHGLLFFFAGVWLLLESMSIVSISLWALWPVLLIVAGAGSAVLWHGFAGSTPSQAAVPATTGTVPAAQASATRPENQWARATAQRQMRTPF